MSQRRASGMIHAKGIRRGGEGGKVVICELRRGKKWKEKDKVNRARWESTQDGDGGNGNGESDTTAMTEGQADAPSIAVCARRPCGGGPG